MELLIHPNTPLKIRYRGLDQCAILSTLVSAVQELTNRVIALEAQL